VWGKGKYVIAGGPPFMLTKQVAVIHDEVAYEVIANFPSLEAAVMFVELNYEEPEPESITLDVLRRSLAALKGVL
jgi:hypothetical protein